MKKKPIKKRIRWFKHIRDSWGFTKLIRWNVKKNEGVCFCWDGTKRKCVWNLNNLLGSSDVVELARKPRN